MSALTSRQDSVHIVPNVDLLHSGAEKIFDMLQLESPNHEQISDLLILLSEAMSDVDALVEITPNMASVDALRAVIRKCHNRISESPLFESDKLRKSRD